MSNMKRPLNGLLVAVLFSAAIFSPTVIAESTSSQSNADGWSEFFQQHARAIAFFAMGGLGIAVAAAGLVYVYERNDNNPKLRGYDPATVARYSHQMLQGISANDFAQRR